MVGLATLLAFGFVGGRNDVGSILLLWFLLLCMVLERVDDVLQAWCRIFLLEYHDNLTIRLIGNSLEEYGDKIFFFNAYFNLC